MFDKFKNLFKSELKKEKTKSNISNKPYNVEYDTSKDYRDFPSELKDVLIEDQDSGAVKTIINQSVDNDLDNDLKQQDPPQVKKEEIQSPELTIRLDDEVFKRATKILDRNEGGWNNTPGDAGGETMFGIARNFHPNWSGWAIVDDVGKRYPKGSDEFKNIVDNNKRLYELAVNYYKTVFWYPSNCDKLPEKVAIVTYDMCVNSGLTPGQKMLQQSINDMGIKCDDGGQIGDLTLSALDIVINQYGEDILVKAMIKRRYNFYLNIVKNKPSWGKFLKGAINRLKYLSKELLNEVPSYLQ